MTNKPNPDREELLEKSSETKQTQKVDATNFGIVSHSKRHVFQNKHWDEIFRRAIQAEKLVRLPALHT